jgi:cytochrome c553
MNKIILILSYLTITGSTLLVAQNLEVKNTSIEQNNVITSKVIKTTTPVEQKALSADEIAKAKVLYNRCAACHGKKAEKKALNMSEKIHNWDSDKIYSALKGYKNGTFGGSMKGLMKGQVAKLSDTDIKLLSQYIPTLNN